MTDFEPILTDAEYELNQQAITNIEARIAEHEANLAEKIGPHLEAIEAEKEKYNRVINNLKASLFQHKAYAADYWLNDPAVVAHTGFEVGPWQAEVTDLKDLVSAAASDDQWLEFLLPNQVKLNARARKDKRAMYVPGCVPVRKEK